MLSRASTVAVVRSDFLANIFVDGDMERREAVRARAHTREAEGEWGQVKEAAGVPGPVGASVVGWVGWWSWLAPSLALARPPRTRTRTCPLDPPHLARPAAPAAPVCTPLHPQPSIDHRSTLVRPSKPATQPRYILPRPHPQNPVTATTLGPPLAPPVSFRYRTCTARRWGGLLVVRGEASWHGSEA